MDILALDTAQTACSVAVVRNAEHQDRKISRLFEWRPRGHAEVLAQMIGDVVERSGTSFNALDRVAVTVGPGSFTGLRVGIATARAIALAADLPIVGITTFEAVAANACKAMKNTSSICVLFDARRGEIYMQIFDPDLNPVMEPTVCPLESVAERLPDHEIIAIGSGVDLVNDNRLIVSPALNVPDAAIIAEIAATRQLEGSPPEPLYLRDPDAKPQVALLQRQNG